MHPNDTDLLWPEDVHLDRLLPSRLVDCEIATEARTMLTTAGVPHDLWLVEFPTLFTSALDAGHLALCTPEFAEPAVAALVTRDLAALGGAYLLGTMVDRDVEPSMPLHAICLTRATSTVIAVDLFSSRYASHRGTSVRFVNSSLTQYLRCLFFFYTSWPQWRILVRKPDTAAWLSKRRRFVYSYLKRGLKYRDVRVFADPYDHWSALVEDLFADVCMS